jgi:hypothetical protein
MSLPDLTLTDRPFSLPGWPSFTAGNAWEQKTKQQTNNANRTTTTTRRIVYSCSRVVAVTGL